MFREKGISYLGDIRNSNDVRKALKNVNVVFHMAALIDVLLSVKMHSNL